MISFSFYLIELDDVGSGEEEDTSINEMEFHETVVIKASSGKNFLLLHLFWR
jgi:hypothetical protein